MAGKKAYEAPVLRIISPGSEEYMRVMKLFEKEREQEEKKRKELHEKEAYQDGKGKDRIMEQKIK